MGQDSSRPGCRGAVMVRVRVRCPVRDLLCVFVLSPKKKSKTNCLFLVLVLVACSRKKKKKKKDEKPTQTQTLFNKTREIEIGNVRCIRKYATCDLS